MTLAFGLAAFAPCVVITAAWPVPLALAIATVAWTITTVALWFAIYAHG